MTSESDVLKTNEFLRRRKLRLQQVREQSKDIAKKIRQRAKVEKLRQTINLDAKKEKEYFDLQEKFVGRLEQLYSQSLENVGSSHKNAAEPLVQEKPTNRDISKLRGKEAVAELRKRKQEKLDEQKKILDRKLHAREAANELSRDKYATVVKTLSSKSSDNIQTQSEEPIITEINNNPVEKDKAGKDTFKNDMATQWEADELPNEWGSSVPTLSIPKDDRVSIKNLDNEKSEPKRLNLFALSDEMPSSLRGGNSNTPIQASQQQSSVTIVSEYLQNRNLRLREARPVSGKKSDDLQSIKETILRSRASKIDGNYSNVCHVLDKQLIPVPSWTAEIDSCLCRHCHNMKPMQPVTNVLINKTNSFQSSASPFSSSAFKDERRKPKNKKPVSGKADRSKTNLVLNKKPSITMYNHSTRDTRSFNNEAIIVREPNTSDDAYLNALKETSILNETKTRELEKKKEDLRNKVAVTREKVDKEYKDTLAFLNALSKEKPNVTHNASHMDYDRQQIQNDKRQKQMQDEFKRIEKECIKKTCKHKNRPNRCQSRSPDSIERPFQYDWMPVPETDFPVHTVPNKNTVKFNDVDTYHEYRSRHKHTPPTKHPKKVETLVIDSSETDSSERTDRDLNEGLSDGERIVIYKILDSKRKRDGKVKVINRVKSGKESERCVNVEAQDNTKNAESAFTVKHGEAMENLSEGIYKVGENGDNIASAYFENNSNVPTEQQGGSKKSATSQNVEQQVPSTSVKNVTSFRCDHACPGCKCRHQPLSAAPSTCSFQTAPNDAPEGFVKLIDGQETGKFYIGASGFLKDDNYEVVIQLKKKEIEKERNSSAKEADDVVEDLTKPDPIHTEEPKNLTKDTEVQSFAIDVKESAAQTSVDREVDVEVAQGEELESKSKHFEDKNVNTTFRDSFAIPDDVPKSDPIRPATSTYTQTSFSSPNSRPVFLHMTSSTSTAYMSPPDFVVPQFLRRRVPEVENDKHKQCSRSSRTRKCKHVSSAANTPPNTARSDEFIPEEKKHKLCHRNHKHKSSSTLHRGSSKSIHPTHSLKSVPKLRNPDVNKIDPVVKKYVNKLLALNKQGLKAIQVINQDCSSVNTPSSSIVNAPYNMEKNASLDNKISLEQIKIMLEQQIVNDYAKRANKDSRLSDSTNNRSMQKSKKKQVHKVKSLNISRHLFKNKQTNDSHQLNVNLKKRSSSSTSDCLTQNNGDFLAKPKSGSKTSLNKQKPSDSEPKSTENKQAKRHPCLTPCSSNHTKSDFYTLNQHRPSSNSTESEKRDVQTGSLPHIPPTDNSTNTSGIESEINFIKSAENKLQNMDKIADLTEKCMNRLSNLAKVLEEVRRNKSMVYSQISTSDTASDSEFKHKIPDDRQVCHSTETEERNDNHVDLPYQENVPREYIPLLKDIPKPLTPSTLSLSTISEKSNAPSTTSEQTKFKARPPPALSRINLKIPPDNFVVPHELSTVMEVDSPMSVKLKNQSSRQNLYQESVQEPTVSDTRVPDGMQLEQNKRFDQANSSKTRSKTPSVTSDDTKVEMMDMKLFNDIMLKPFVSLQEYAKQCDVLIEDASNMEDQLKNEQGGDEISSLHSDGSLPDVVSELLKRKLISEPFKFDTATASQLTTSMSSESSLSLLALSKMYKAKRRSKHIANKENVAETSETLSLSSNPDLENAFQKLGMGWASSTLKKTKERLALSSSSNTSSSSYSQLKFKSFNKDPPTLATDSSLSDSNRAKNSGDNAKNAVQQTSVTNSMIVKEFLTNELAKKITFTNQSSRNADEFVSLYETKMPEEIRDTPEKTREGDHSVVSQTNRARTSTPVQIFKSTTYHTTSSSNTSNGLFSNADELSSVKVTSTSIRNHSTSDRDDLTIPNYSLKRKGSDNSKSA